MRVSNYNILNKDPEKSSVVIAYQSDAKTYRAALDEAQARAERWNRVISKAKMLINFIVCQGHVRVIYN